MQQLNTMTMAPLSQEHLELLVSMIIEDWGKGPGEELTVTEVYNTLRIRLANRALHERITFTRINKIFQKITSTEYSKTEGFSNRFIKVVRGKTIKMQNPN